MTSDNHHTLSYDARKERIVDINVDEFVTAKKLTTVCRKAPLPHCRVDLCSRKPGGISSVLGINGGDKRKKKKRMK